MTSLRVGLFVFWLLVVPAANPAEEMLSTSGEPGRMGGRLVLAQRAEPKTFNPVLAADSASRDVIQRLMADLVHIDRVTGRTVPALAKSWTISPDGRHYLLHLRRDLRFSDGHPFDAADVVFTFRVYLDERIHSPQRDLLIVGGKPISVRQRDSYTVELDVSEPYAPAERLFDSIAILPRHRLERAYDEGRLAQVWSLDTSPSEIAGLGPFRLKEYVAGQRVVLERNPYYWKQDRQGHRLPYLDTLVFLFVAGEDAQTLRFEAGETDMISRVGARNFAVLEKRLARSYALQDLGPGLEYNFLFFNLNDLSGRNLPQATARQVWFRDVRFRQAISAAIDREGIVRLVYQGRGTPLWGHVTPGNRLWFNGSLPHPPPSRERARSLLKSAGFNWASDGALMDGAGRRVEFTIVAGANSPERVQMATIVQEDLREIGISVRVVPLEFRGLLDRLLNSRDYEACVLGLGGGDADPAAEMNVWLSSGGTHLWRLGDSAEPEPWQVEIDSLMRRQLTTMNYGARRRLYDRVQSLVAENLPIVPLVSPHVLVGARAGLGNFRPAILDPNTLWNVEELFWRTRPAAGGTP